MRGRRNLILVAKLLQNVANNNTETTEQDSKEPYLQLCIPFVKEAIPKRKLHISSHLSFYLFQLLSLFLLFIIYFFVIAGFAEKILDENADSDLRPSNYNLKTDNREGLVLLRWMQRNRESLCAYLLERHDQKAKMDFEDFLIKVIEDLYETKKRLTKLNICSILWLPKTKTAYGMYDNMKKNLRQPDLDLPRSPRKQKVFTPLLPIQGSDD